MDRAGLATPELLPEPERTDDAPHGVPAQEIRLALVLTGGVSLAVWMGGVASELQRLARGDGHYRTLCELTGSRIVIDTVGGSSAGGINGAILAMALTHGTDASSVRDVWVERRRCATCCATTGSRTGHRCCAGTAISCHNCRPFSGNCAGSRCIRASSRCR